MKYLPTVNTPGYLPDTDHGLHDDTNTAWQTLCESRENYEEQQLGYEDLPAYTYGRDVLKQLSEGELEVARGLAGINEDGQIVSFDVAEDGTGTVVLQTSLDWRDASDHSLPEVFTVTPTEESE